MLRTLAVLSLIAVGGCAPHRESSSRGPEPGVDAAGATAPGLRAVQLASGDFHSCARLADGTVRCWGKNGQGQLGDGTRWNRVVPVVVKRLTDVVEIAAEGSRTCAVRANGEVWCWGEFSIPFVPGRRRLRLPHRVKGWANVRQVALSFDHECALTKGGKVWCRGSNTRGGIGDGTTTERSTPVEVRGLGDAIDVAAGYSYSCALRSDGTVWCWGWNDDDGNLGDGSGQDQHEPVVIPTLEDVVDIDSGFKHTCAVRQDGAVLCWGSNSHRQLGEGTSTGRPIPTEVPGLGHAVELSLGRWTSCAVEREGVGHCWGDDAEAPSLWRSCPAPALFHPRAPSRRGGYRIGPEDVFCPVPALVPVDGVTALSPADQHACAIGAGGAVLCWGSNFYGAIGDGRGGDIGEDSRAPTRVSG